MTPQDLKAWRTSKGLTQKQAAEELGIGARHYQKLEAGEIAVSPTLTKLLKLLGA